MEKLPCTPAGQLKRQEMPHLRQLLSTLTVMLCGSAAAGPWYLRIVLMAGCPDRWTVVVGAGIGRLAPAPALASGFAISPLPSVTTMATNPSTVPTATAAAHSASISRIARRAG